MGYKKEYIKGSASIKEFGNNGHAINVSILDEDFLKIPLTMSKKGVGYRNFSLGLRSEVDEYGNAYSMYYSYKEGEKPTAPAASTKEDDEFWAD